MANFRHSLGFNISSEGALVEPTKYKTQGFTAGYKLPAPHFNWIVDKTSKSIDEIHEFLTAKTIRAGADLNQITDIGMYVYSAADSASIGNTPEKAQSTMLVMPRLLPNDTNNRVQVVITQTNTLYIRNFTGGTWEVWTRYRKQNDIVDIKYGGTSASDVPTARKNLGLPETCVTITDWNEATKTGWYMANNAKNAPSISEGGTAWYFGYAIAHATGYVFQEVYQFSVSASAILVPKFIRAQTAGVWGQWYDVTVQRTVPQAAKMEHIKNLTSDAQEQFNNIYKNKMDLKPSFIELTPADGTNNGGYIDFHYAGSDKDYTVRLIEEVEGILKLRGALITEGNLYENNSNRVYSTGHKPTPADIGAAEAVKHKIITYSSLADIGLTAGSETIVNIASKMTDNSMLVYQTDSASADIYPQSSLVVTVKRVNTNRVEFIATRVNGSQMWFGNYHKDSGWTGWKEIYHEGALPTPAQIGAATSGHSHSLASLGLVTGTYTGTGSARSSAINIGGSGKVVFIWASNIDGSLGAKGYITPQGGVMTCGTINDQAFNTETIGIRSYSRGSQNNCYFEDGKLYINSMSSDIAMNYINKSGVTYYYQVV